MPEIDDDKTKDYIVSPREGDGHPGAQKTNNAATGASAAGIRAIRYARSIFETYDVPYA